MFVYEAENIYNQKVKKIVDDIENGVPNALLEILELPSIDEIIRDSEG